MLTAQWQQIINQTYEQMGARKVANVDWPKFRKKNYCDMCAKRNWKVKLEFVDCETRERNYYSTYEYEKYRCPICRKTFKLNWRKIKGKGKSGIDSW